MPDLVPAPGDPSTLIERVRAYVRQVDRSLPEKWREGPESLIDRYLALAFEDHRDSIPLGYLATLRALGGDDGGLFANLRIETGVATLVRYYAQCLHAEPESLNPRLPVVALHIVGDQISLDLGESAPRPAVVETSDGERSGPLAHDWETLVMQAAMLHVEARRLPHARWLSRRTGAGTVGSSELAAIVDHARSLELTFAWPTDPQHLIAVGEDRSLFVTIRRDGSLLGYLFSREEEESDRERVLAERVGASSARRAQLVNGVLRDAGDVRRER